MKKESPMWHSVGILAGVVILIVAFTRGWLMSALLLIAACTWGAWLLSTQRPPASKRRSVRRPRAADTAPAPAEGQDAAATNTLLLLHVNQRITEMLHAAFPNVTWKWCVKNPLRLILKGGVGRIRVYGVEGFEYADIAIETTGKVNCNRGGRARRVPGGRQHHLQADAGGRRTDHVPARRRRLAESRRTHAADVRYLQPGRTCAGST